MIEAEYEGTPSLEDIACAYPWRDAATKAFERRVEAVPGSVSWVDGRDYPEWQPNSLSKALRARNAALRERVLVLQVILLFVLLGFATITGFAVVTVQRNIALQNALYEREDQGNGIIR